MMKYKDNTLPADIRAKDLLERMTVIEKVGQLNQRLYGFDIYKREGNSVEISDEFKEEVIRWNGLGVLYGLYRADPWSGRDDTTGLSGTMAVKAYNLLQSYVMDHSRLGIPMLLSSECPHGHQAVDGYLLPVNLAMGASFSRKLVYQAYRICGRQMKELGVDLALISMLDILRDPRWGRSEECFGEDPYLASVMSRAVVKGVTEEGVDVVAKHFAAQGETTGGVNASAAGIGERELREIHFPAAYSSVDSGAYGVMAAYNDIDGIPCHANSWLLKSVLREEMKFQGIVMADGLAVDRLKELAGNTINAGARALNAGVDVSLWDAGFTCLQEGIQSGRVSEKRLDEAVLRVLRLKFSRGLFDHPFLGDENKKIFDFSAEQENLDLARQSVVLLKNKNDLLPVDKTQKLDIAVIGPDAFDLYSQLGDYTPPVTKGITIAEGMSYYGSRHGNLKISLNRGYDSEGSVDAAKIRDLASSADITVLVLGGSSSRFGKATFDKNGAVITEDGNVSMDCGEGVDLSSLELPDDQQNMAAAACQTAKKVVTVIIAGRPYLISKAAEKTDALLYAFYPGPKGGRAVAELIFGDARPSGRLPVSLPKSAGELPVYYNYRNSYRAMHYADQKGPLYPFGYGLGYDQVDYFDFSLNSQKLCIRRLKEEPLTITMRVRNSSKHLTFAVPMVFIRHLNGSVTPRKSELKGFEKRTLKPNETIFLKMSLGYDSFSVWNERMRYGPEEGRVRIEIKDGGNLLWSKVVNLV